MSYTSGNPIVDKSFQFALDIVEYTEALESKRKYVIANQLAKCGTAVGANVRESQHAESRADFIHKLKFEAKEAEETQYFPLICKYSKSYPDPEKRIPEIESIQNIIEKNYLVN